MQFSHYKDLPLTLAVTLVNSEDVVDGIDNLDVAGVQDLIDRSDLDALPTSRCGAISKAVRRLRTQVRAVFESRTDRSGCHRDQYDPAIGRRYSVCRQPR